MDNDLLIDHDEKCHEHELPLARDGVQRANQIPPSVDVHPVAVLAAMAAQAVFMLAAWIAFGVGETALWLYFATLISVIYLGLIGIAGARSHIYGQWRSPRCSFADFLKADVGIFTGMMRGRDAFVEIAAPSLIVAIGSVILAVIWMVEH